MSLFPTLSAQDSAQDTLIPNRGQAPQWIRKGPEYITRLQEKGAFYRNRTEAKSALTADPARVFAVWKRDTTEAANYGMFILLHAADSSLPYRLTPEELPDYVESAEKVRELLLQGAFVKDFEAAVTKMKSDSSNPIVCWLKEKKKCRKFYFLSRREQENPDHWTLTEGVTIQNFAQAIRKCDERPIRLRRVVPARIIIIEDC